MSPKCLPTDSYVLAKQYRSPMMHDRDIFHYLDNIIYPDATPLDVAERFGAIKMEIESGAFEDRHIRAIENYLGGRLFNLRHEAEAFVAHMDTMDLRNQALEICSRHDHAQAVNFHSFYIRNWKSPVPGYLSPGIIKELRAYNSDSVNDILDARLRKERAEVLGQGLPDKPESFCNSRPKL